MNDPYTLVQDTVLKICKTRKINRTEVDYDCLVNGIIDGLDEHKDIVVGKWLTEYQNNGAMYNTFTRKILSEPEKLIDGFGNEIVIAKNHFMCEIFRIPLYRECTLGSVLSLACYTALVSFSLKKDDFPDGMVRAFKNMNMTALASYIDNIDHYYKIISNIDAKVFEDAIQYMIENRSTD